MYVNLICMYYTTISDDLVFTKKRGNKEIAFHTTIKHLLKLHIINKSTTHYVLVKQYQ